MKKVLLLDDDNVIQISFQLAFESIPGAELVCTSNLAEALKVKNGQAYDLYLVDIQMPGELGIKLVEHIRKEDPNVPICIVTAYSEKYDEEIKRFDTMGWKYRVENKPIDNKRIEALIVEILGPEILKSEAA